MLVLIFSLMSPICVPNFSPIGVCVRGLLRILRSVRNEEESNEEIKMKLCSLISRNGWSNVLQIWYVDSPNWPALL